MPSEILAGDEATSGQTSLFEALDVKMNYFKAAKAIALYSQLKRYVNLLLDVHGYQIFEMAAFSGDPHPGLFIAFFSALLNPPPLNPTNDNRFAPEGNILVLSDGKLGLIDFGQTKYLGDDSRLAYAQVVMDLGNKAPSKQIAKSMKKAGFQTQFDDDETLSQYAALFFDSDHVSRSKGYATPQHYFSSLMSSNPLLSIPDDAIMVARVSVLFRGMSLFL